MISDNSTPPSGDPPDEADRLDSWKEIAAYLRRDARTVRRWERSERLPVHRHPHRKRFSVYAYKSELEAWWKNGHDTSQVVRETAVATRRRLLWLALGIVGAATLAAGFVARERFWRSGVAPGSRIILAVMPFQNLSGRSDQEYLSDGFTEEVITQLGRLSPDQLAVISGSSVMRYNGGNKRTDEIGRELKADYLLEGGMRLGGGRIRITAHLVRVSAGTQVWAEEYDRKLEDVVILQSDVARAITDEIQLRMLRRRQKARTVNPAAYQFNLHGQYHLNRRQGGRELARRYFEQAIEVDPAYAAPYAGLADSYLRLVTFGPVSAADGWAKAESSARRALELDDTLPGAHTSLGTILLYRDWNWAEARKEFLRALALNPSDPHAHSNYAVYLRSAGRMEEAIRERQRALELDPLRVDLHVKLGTDLVFGRRYEEGIAEFRKACELERNYVPAIDGLADAYARTADFPEAVAAQIRLLNLRENSDLAGDFERVYRTQGYRAASTFLDERNLNKYLEQYRNARGMNCWNLSFTYARLGRTEEALAWLAKALETRDTGVLLATVDPDVDSLRQDPRFRSLLRRLNVPPE